MTALDDRPTMLAEAVQRERDAYLAGREDGYAAAEADMATHWAALGRRIRADAERISGPIPQPVARPQSDDSIWFTAAEWANWAVPR